MVLAILLAAAVIANVVFIANFNTARANHIKAVQNQILWLYTEISRAACIESNDYTASPETRELRLAQTHSAVYGLSSALHGLSIHHNHRAGGADFPIFNLRVILENIFRNDDAPTANLQVLADKIFSLYDSLEPHMATQDIFELINETNRAIDRHFGW